MKKVVNDAKGATRLTRDFDQCPIIVSLPFKERRVMILYSIWEQKGQIIGVTGFHVAAPLVAIDVDQFVRGLIPLGASRERTAICLPTMRQLLGCRDAEEVLAVEGESNENVLALVGMPRALTWTPTMLQRMKIKEHLPRALDMLMAFIELLKEIQSQTSQGIIQMEDTWGRYTRSLWVIAKGLSDKSRFSNILEDPDVDAKFIKTIKRTDEFRSPSTGGPKINQEDKRGEVGGHPGQYWREPDVDDTQGTDRGQGPEDRDSGKKTSFEEAAVEVGTHNSNSGGDYPTLPALEGDKSDSPGDGKKLGESMQEAGNRVVKAEMPAAGQAEVLAARQVLAAMVGQPHQ